MAQALSPRVSVVVPAYNLARFLPAALDSALAQDWPADALEVVVVDDGSTDETPQVLEGYRDRVTVVRQPNGGLVRAVSRGLQDATGDYVALLDADDEWPRDRLRRHLAHLEARPEVALVHGDMEIIDARGMVSQSSLFATMRPGPVRGRVLGRVIASNFVTASAVTFRASILPAACPIPDDAIYPDWWLTAIAATVGEVDHLDSIVARYRFHGQNMNLGVTPGALDRAERKELRWRRWMLRHLAGDPSISLEELCAAFTAWQRALVRATADADGDVRVLVAIADDEYVRGRDRAAAGVAALRAGDVPGAARLFLHALAENPWDGAARVALELTLQRPAPAPNTEPSWLALPTRASTTVAWAAELDQRPALLERYGSLVGGDDDATLVVLVGPGEDMRALIDLVTRFGLADDDAADVLAHPGPATTPAAAYLASRTDAVLSLRPPAPFDALPQHAAVAG
jgi:glycosyl transferase family 2